MKRNLKEGKGITLIALVITIVVLIIIAGVTIGSLTSDKGVIKEARTAKELAEKASLEEQVDMAIIKAEQKHKSPGMDDVIEELKNAKVISKDDQVNKDTGAIRTDLGYEITGKLDDYIGKISTGDGSDNTTGDNNTTGGGSTGDGSGSIIPPTTADTTPFVPEGAQKLEGTIDTGLVMTDSNGNEWVWIEVPKSIYTNPEYAGTPPTSPEDYEKIESILQKYAYNYRNTDYADSFIVGFNNVDEYNQCKQLMLKRVYENGGFYIGRYEAGTITPRYTKDDELVTAIIRQNVYPYNFITCAQAQTKSKELATGGKTSSLMFGIQWDLVLKFIEEKGRSLGETIEERQEKLKTNSNAWGNYSDVSFIITRGKYIYEKPSSQVFLTTGATERNAVLEIYDLVGNLEEWTLEKDMKEYYVRHVARGGACRNYGTVSAISRYSINPSYNPNTVGFRPALW